MVYHYFPPEHQFSYPYMIVLGLVSYRPILIRGFKIFCICLVNLLTKVTVNSMLTCSPIFLHFYLHLAALMHVLGSFFKKVLEWYVSDSEFLYMLRYLLLLLHVNNWVSQRPFIYKIVCFSKCCFIVYQHLILQKRI